MLRAFICVSDAPSSSRSGWRVAITDSVDLRLYSESLRSSPIFSRDDAGGWLPPTPESRYFIRFFAVSDPVEALGRVPIVQRPKTWFTLGLASIVTISDNLDDLDQIGAAIEEYRIASESWVVDGGIASKEQVTVSLPAARTIEPARFLIAAPGALPLDIVTTVEELNHNLHHCACNASHWLPSFLEVVAGAAERGKVLIDEIKECLEVARQPDADASDEVAASIAVEQQKEVNLCVDQLISLNSTLAYVNSQAFHGQIPLLESSACLVRPHSLLGIGTAFRGVARLVNYIEEGFEKFPTLLAADRLYDQPKEGHLTAEGRPAFKSVFESIDSLLSGEGHGLFDRSLPKLPYFSSRYGFSEGPGIVTVASQCLECCDTVRWSLLTLTHEMMHAHFDAVATYLLSSDQDDDPLLVFLRAAGDVEASKGPDEPITFSTPKEGLRRALIYLVSVLESARLQRGDAEEQWSPTPELEFSACSASSRDELLSEFVENRKIFEECLVHAFDLFYFYQGNRKRYLRALWLSWATVPGVVENLEFYVLRSLVCVGYSATGPVFPNRFDTAVSVLVAELDRIVEEAEAEGNLIIQRALQFLGDDKRLDLLRYLFDPLVRVVELFDNFLFSDNLRLYFEAGDSKVVSGSAGEGVTYALETCELSGERVENPIAFLSDRLRRSDEAPSSHAASRPQESRESAWVLLMLCN